MGTGCCAHWCQLYCDQGRLQPSKWVFPVGDWERGKIASYVEYNLAISFLRDAALYAYGTPYGRGHDCVLCTYEVCAEQRLTTRTSRVLQPRGHKYLVNFNNHTIACFDRGMLTNRIIQLDCAFWVNSYFDLIPFNSCD